MRELLRYLRPYGGKVALAMGMIAVSTFCNLMLPTIMSRIVNDGVYNADFPLHTPLLRPDAAGGPAGAMFDPDGGADQQARWWRAFSADMRRDIFRKVSTLTFEEFGAMGTAALLTRSTHDVETVSWVASMLSGTVVTIPVLFLGGVLLALSKDVALSLILLCFIPTVFVAVGGHRPADRPPVAEVRRLRGPAERHHAGAAVGHPGDPGLQPGALRAGPCGPGHPGYGGEHHQGQHQHGGRVPPGPLRLQRRRGADPLRGGWPDGGPGRPRRRGHLRHHPVHLPGDERGW